NAGEHAAAVPACHLHTAGALFDVPGFADTLPDRPYAVPKSDAVSNPAPERPFHQTIHPPRSPSSISLKMTSFICKSPSNALRTIFSFNGFILRSIPLSVMTSPFVLD